MWDLKRNDTNELTKQKWPHRHREWTYGCQGEGWREGTVRDLGKDMHTMLNFKWITTRDLMYSTWNSAQWGEWIHVYVWLSPLDVHLKLSQHC